MRSATCLTLLAIGAILTFAVTGHPSFLNLQVVGVVVMATGVAGLFLPWRGWLRRPIVIRASAHGPGRRQRSPGFQELGPGTGTAEQNGNPAGRPADSPTVPDLMAPEHPDDN